MSTPSPPLVTYILLCFNQSRFVLETLEAMRAQRYPNEQWLLLDDASSDDSVALIRSWLHEHGVNATFVVHHTNRGICASINELVRLSLGKYVAICAADDLWLPGRTAYLVERMEALGESYGVLYGDVDQIDECGRPLPLTFIQEHGRGKAPPSGKIEHHLLEGNFIPVPSTIVRRDCFERVGLYDERLCFEDWDMWLRIAKHYQFAAVERKTAAYRVVGNSLTRRLLSASSVPRFASEYMIFRKGLEDHTSDAARREGFAKALSTCAYVLFDLRAKGSWRYLLGAARHHVCLRTLVRLLLCMAPIGWKARQALLERVDWRMNRLEGSL